MTKVQWRALVALAEGVCVYCRVPGDLTRDHIVPRSKGGRTNWKNIAPACYACNQAKANLHWETFMRKEGRESQVPFVRKFIAQAKKIKKRRPRRS